MSMMNPLSAPYHYYMDTLVSPLPEQGKATEILKKIVLIAAGIILMPLFGIMKLIGDKLPIQTAVVFVNTDTPFKFIVNDQVAVSYKKHGDKFIEDIE